ncbi:MAG TPA: YciI family protein [Myxococcaceae bacterium]|jgi:hypothetical protein|nr:YciI family protein [Myxococcaceae bacterium]
MVFLVLGYDGVDPEAPARRAAARPAHLATLTRLRAAGHFLDGGAILDDSGRMVGSMLILDFPSRAELDAWLSADAYTTGRVWKDVNVRPFRRLTFD